MLRNHFWKLVILLLAGLLLVACAAEAGESEVEGEGEVEPARVEEIAGTDLKRVVLTEKAAERIALQTDKVREEAVARGSDSATTRMVIPYAAVIYGLHGETWAYTNPEPLTYVRHPISIDFIEGDLAVLADGPPVGTTVVTAGAAELFGTEFGVGK